MTGAAATGDAVDLTAICVTFRSRDVAPAGLRSVLSGSEAAGLRVELIVVDNASDDGTADAVAEAVPEATMIRNATNVGFGVANNQAFELARGRWWLLINPDASLDREAVARLAAALDDEPRLAVAGPSVAGAGMGGAESAGMLPSLRSLAGHFLFINRLLPVGRGGAWRGFQVRPRADRAQRVEWISAAAMLVRPDAIRGVGGFDASIFLYGEDLDLGARLAEAGWQLALVPGAQAWHAIGGSQGPASTAWLDGVHSFLLRRGTPRWRRTAAFAIIAVGLGIRAIAALAGAGDEAGMAHRRRMRAGAARALSIAFGGARGGQ